jgi:TPR repeat protein
MSALAEMYEQGEPTGTGTPNAHRSARLLCASALLGHPTALHNLALTLSQSINPNATPRDPVLATRLCYSAARAGHTEAASMLGSRYLKGDGCRQSLELGLKWLNVAANANANANANGSSGSAEFQLGMLALNGMRSHDQQQSVDVNVAVAVQWWRKAALRGHPPATHRLGEYYRDIGKSKLGLLLLEHSAALGHQPSAEAARELRRVLNA